METIKEYLNEINKIVDKLPVDKIETITGILWKAYADGKQIFMFGNGGCAALANHLACDLAKTTVIPGARRFKAISLSANVALMTAWANDTYYGNIYGEQLANFFDPGDVVIGLTGSGNSLNIINALKFAEEKGAAATITITAFDGGIIKNVAQHALIVPCNNMQRAEDIFSIVVHSIISNLRDRVKKEMVDAKNSPKP
jgi:D-sedoheptulose 7-phosphate isomerase